MMEGVSESITKEREALEDGEEEMEEEDNSTKCGLGSWRPSCLQRFANLKSFTATLSLLSVLGNMNYSYYTAVITQIELNFGLSSSWTGFIKNIDNIGYLCCTLLVSHFCRYANKPRLFASSTVLASAAIFIFAVPHFLYGSRYNTLPTSNASFYNSTTKGKYELCDETGSRTDQCAGGNAGGLSAVHAFNTGALALFIISELLQGVAQSPKFTLSITYMDDNSKNSPKHIGVMLGMRSFAPVVGFLLGAWASSIYVDLTDPGLSEDDPRWVGAWWLGFVICAACALLPALPLALFPRNISKQTPEQIEQERKAQNTKSNMKDFPVAIIRLLKNPLLICLLVGASFNVSLSGYATFVPKYLAMQFQTTASKASILTGCIGIASWALGPMVSGILVSKLKMTPHMAVQFVAFSHFVALVGFTIKMFLGCPDMQWATEMTLDQQETNPTCSLACGCDPEEFLPICGSDGLNYFSPCLAGCQNWESVANASKKVFSNCNCISNGTGSAVPGYCPVTCHMLIPYILVHVIATFCSSMTFVPMLTAVMRSSIEKDKALCLAIFGSVVQLASFPSPMIFGMVIDTSCMVSQMTCGHKGACLLYDRTDFRFKYHGFAIVMKFCALICYIVAWYKTRHFNQPILSEAKVQGEQTDAEQQPEVKSKLMDEESDV